MIQISISETQEKRVKTYSRLHLFTGSKCALAESLVRLPKKQSNPQKTRNTGEIRLKTENGFSVASVFQVTVGILTQAAKVGLGDLWRVRICALGPIWYHKHSPFFVLVVEPRVYAAFICAWNCCVHVPLLKAVVLYLAKCPKPALVLRVFDSAIFRSVKSSLTSASVLLHLISASEAAAAADTENPPKISYRSSRQPSSCQSRFG